MKKSCKSCKYELKSQIEEPCFDCVFDSTPYSKYVPKPVKKAKKERTDETDLSKIVITLTEIEHPDKGRGCKVEVNGEASVRSMTKMLHTLFCALAEKEPRSFLSALDTFIASNIDSEN